MVSHRDNLRGIAAMCVAMACFITNDALIKLANERLPLGEIIFVRGVLASIIIGLVVVALGQHRVIGVLWERHVILRTIGEIGGTLTYLTALFRMPIANSTTILQTTPLALTAVGALFLGRHVGWRRWTAIAIGFTGVLIVIRPGVAGFDAYSLFAIGTVVFVVLRDVATSRIPAEVPTTLLSASTVVALTLTGLALLPAESWHWPSAPEFLTLLGAAIALLVAFAVLIIALRVGDITITAPFRYTGVFWAVLYGAFIWQELPDQYTYAGMALIIGTGIYAFVRERKRVAADARPS